jgi:signal transduction histidine kinase
LICLSAGVFTLSAQDQGKILEYRNMLRQADDIGRFDLFCKISFEYRNSFPDSTIYYGNEALKLGEQLKLAKGLARPLSFIAFGYSAKGDLVKSFRFHDQAIGIAIRQKDSLQIGYAHNNLGRILLDVKDYGRAEGNFNAALQIFQSLGERSGTAYALRSLSEVYVSQNNFRGALELLERAYQIRKSTGDKRATISALLEAAAVHRKLNDLAEAEEHLNEARDLALDLSDKETDAEVLMAQIELNLSAGIEQKVLELIRTTEGILVKLDNELLRLKFLVLSGKAYYELDRRADAKSVWLKSRLLAEKLNNPGIEKDILEHLLKVSSAADQSVLLSRLKIIEDEINQRELIMGSEKLDLQLSVQKSEIEKQELKLKLTEEQIKAERQRSDNMVLMILFITFLTGGVLTSIFLFRQRMLNRQLRLQNELILRTKTKMSEVNNRLEIQNRELQELSAEKDSLMSIVAHDLRSPLSHISGFARLIGMEGPLNPDQKEYVDRIAKTVDHGYRLVSDLLNLNNYKISEDKLQVSEIILKDFSETLLTNFSKGAALKNINLQVQISGESTFITDLSLLTRILENLVSNALKFSPLNSMVKVEFNAGTDELIVVVSDSGPGFTEEDISGMFRQFKKLSARPTAGEPSNGLGLAILKHIANKLGGSVELISEPRHSAIFRVKIPKGSY